MTRKSAAKDPEPPETEDTDKDRHWRIPERVYQAVRDFAADEDLTETAAVRRLLSDGLLVRGYVVGWKRPRHRRGGR